ncbi:MAG: methyl-accepting chemotaxis protein [Pseudomonadota bacterium]
MALPLDWRKDPVVTVEQSLVPLLVQVPVHLCARALGVEGRGEAGDLVEQLLQAASDMDEGFDGVLAPAGFPLTEDARDTVLASARVFRDFAGALGQQNVSPEALLSAYREELYPAAARAIDTVRAVFISGVLKRQAHHATLSGAAMAELGQLSRAIQFVAINASIEAARSGTAGQSFALIASEIRELAKKARNVIEAQAS